MSTSWREVYRPGIGVMSVDAGMAILPVEPAWTEREPSGMESSGELAACCMQEPRSARCPALARHITALACAPHLHAISPHLLVPRTCTPYHRTCLCPALARHITALACAPHLHAISPHLLDQMPALVPSPAPHLHAISPHLLVPRTCTPYHRTCLSRRLPRTCTPYHRTCSACTSKQACRTACASVDSKLAAQHARATQTPVRAQRP